MTDQILVPDEDPIVLVVIGAGPVSTTNFTLTYFDAADIKVYVDGTLQTADVDYVLTGTAGYTDGYPGGSLAWTVAKSNVAVAIVRDQAKAFSPVFGATGAFDPTRFNLYIEQLWAALQEMESQVDRCIRVAVSDDLGALTVVGDVTARKGKVAFFHATTGDVTLSTVDWADVETFITSAADITADVAAAAASAAAAAASAAAAAASAAAIALPLAIASGGTGQTSAAAALTALGGVGLAVANTFTANQEVVYSNAGATNQLRVKNSEGANAASHARVLIEAGGTSGGDAWAEFSIPGGGLAWSLGVDNSDSDAFKLQKASGLGGTDILRVLNGVVVGSATDQGAGTLGVQTNYYQGNAKLQPILQRIIVTDATFTASAATTPAYDDTQPLVTEGTQLFSQSISAKIATSTIRIRSWLVPSTSTASVHTNQIHIDGADAVSVGTMTNMGTGVQGQNLVEHDYAPGNTSAHTISVRGGSQSASGYNGSQAGGARKFGGFTKQFLELTEIAA